MENISVSEIISSYTPHHTSRCRRYVSRKNPDGVAERYSGRFGDGYKVYTPAWDSTQYCYVTYYIK